jgi:hypothetical protein
MILTSPWISANKIHQTTGIKPLLSNVCMKLAIGGRWPYDCICTVHSSIARPGKFFAIQGMWCHINAGIVGLSRIATTALNEVKDTTDKILIENNFTMLTETDWQKACLLR